MKKIILAALLCLVASSAFAQKPPINGVAGPTTSAQFGSIITDAVGSGKVLFAPSADTTINGVPCTTGSSCTVPSALIAGTTPITGATNSNGLFYNSGNVFTNLASANNGVLVTNGSGVPSISTTLPASLTQIMPMTWDHGGGLLGVWTAAAGNETEYSISSPNNVLVLQNTAPNSAAGYAAVAFRDNTGFEQAAFGSSQANGIGNIYAGFVYQEASGTFDPALFGQVPNGYAVFQTGPYATTANAFTAMSWTAGVVTGTTTTAHGLVPGQVVDITGVSPSGYNGRYFTAAGTTGSTVKYNTSNPGPVTVQGAVNTSRNWTRLDMTKDQFGDLGLWAITGAAAGGDKMFSVYGNLGTVGIGNAVAFERANATFPVNTLVLGQNVQRLLSSGHSTMDIAWNGGYSVLQFIDTRNSSVVPFGISTDGSKHVEVGSGGVKIFGSSSGSTAITATAAATGSLSLPAPASSDKLVAEAFTATLTNKTMSGSANTFSNLALASLATQATNTIVGNATAGSAAPTALAIGSCSAATSALTWTTNTGFGCNTITPGTGTVTSVSVTTANGVSGTVATATTTPAITLTLGAITPSSIVSAGAVNVNGTTTFADTSAWSTTGLNNAQTYSTSSTAMFSLTPTWSYSSTGNNVRAVVIAPTISPTGATAGISGGIRLTTTLDSSAVNVSQMQGALVTLAINAGYTGTAAQASGLTISASNSGTNAVANMSGLFFNAIGNGNGITSGSITNASISTSGQTAAAGAGGTVANYGISLVMSNGSSAGTTNVGLLINGSGGALADNYAIRSLSTEKSTLAGALLLPNITADTALTDNTVCVTSSGQLYKGTGALGTCLGTSSLRYKTNVQDATDGLLKVAALQPKTFFYKKGYGDDGARKQFGFLAEDVVEIIPGLVTADNDGRPNTVDLLGMVPMMVTAIKELKASNDNLRQDIQLLKTSGRK